MKKKSILGNCYLNNWKPVLAHSIPVTLTFDPKSIGFLLLPMMDVWTRYEVGQGVLVLFIRNGLGTFDPGDLDL